MLNVCFNIYFICFDITSFIFYFIFEVNTLIILISLIVNQVWTFYTSLILIKISSKMLKMVKNNKKYGQKNANYGNSSYLRKHY